MEKQNPLSRIKKYLKTNRRTIRKILPVIVVIGFAVVGTYLYGKGKSADQLTWAPPGYPNYTGYQVIDVTEANKWSLGSLDTTKDYYLKFPKTPLAGQVTIRGGRNVVVIGGEIRVPRFDANGGVWETSDPNVSKRRGLLLSDWAGTMHIEGIKFSGDFEDSIRISNKNTNAIAQVQNIWVEANYGWNKNKDGSMGPHGDVLQNWCGPDGELRIDKLTAKNASYQGFMLNATDLCPGMNTNITTIKRTNIEYMKSNPYNGGQPNGAYLYWFDKPQEDKLVVSDVWGLPIPSKAGSRDAWLWVKPSIDPYNRWVNVKQGSPTVDFVSPTLVGVNYVSPGYVGTSTPPPPVDSTPPSVPSSLTAVAGTNQVSLSWTASTDNVGVSGYDVFRNGNKVATSATNSYTDSGLAAGTYSYTVNARDAAGNVSTSSNIASATVAASTTTPTVAISGLTDGQTVAGDITVSAVPKNAAGTLKVLFKIDGALKQTETESPFCLAGNPTGTTACTPYSTKLLPDGQHKLEAVLQDSTGKQLASAQVNFTIKNNIVIGEGLKTFTGTLNKYGTAQFDLDQPKAGTVTYSLSTSDSALMDVRVYIQTGLEVSKLLDVKTLGTNKFNNAYGSTLTFNVTSKVWPSRTFELNVSYPL